MPVLSPQQIYDVAQRHFGDLGEDVVRIMAATALGESGGNTGAKNMTGRDRSYGLWQINLHPDANPDLAGYDLSDPEQNAQAARIILDRQGLGAWSVYTKGVYKKHLPKFDSMSAAKQKGSADAKSATMQGSGGNMTTQGTEAVGGSGVIDQILNYLNNTATHTYNASNLAGWMNPSMLGMGGNVMLPTLAREQWEQERADADRDYAIDVARFGLEQAQFNYQQRVGAADAKYKELGLLAAQRGPENSIAYNYTLRNLAAPEGTQVNPHVTSGGIYQPSNIQIPSGGGGNVSPAPPPPPPPTAPQTSGFGSIAPISNPVSGNVYQPTLGADGQTVTFGGPDGNWQMVNGEFVKTGGGGVSTSTPAASPNPAGAPAPRMGASAPMPTIGSLPVDQRQAFRMAEGGVAGGQQDGRILMLGDEAGGQPTGNEELLLNPTNAPVGVVPNEAIPEGVMQGAQSGGTPSPEEVLALIGQLIASLDLGGEGGGGTRELGDLTGSASPVAAAGGGIFGTTVYSGQEIAGQPALQAMAGNAALDPFGQTGIDMTIPGSATSLPMGHQANLQQYTRLRPSERATVQGAIETPREMGGLGMVFGDWLSDMLNAAPTGRTFSSAAYG